jgi:hypothetical protein
MNASEEHVMQITASQFADVEAAYRMERISASFRNHANGRHLHLLRRNRHPAGGHPTRSTALKAA